MNDIVRQRARFRFRLTFCAESVEGAAAEAESRFSLSEY
jgi:hypothetical protein